MVEWIIGFKFGIGGSIGVFFLWRAFDLIFFFELYVVCGEI